MAYVQFAKIRVTVWKRIKGELKMICRVPEAWIETASMSVTG